MVYGENLILNDDTYVGVSYLIPAFFSVVGLMNTTKLSETSVLNELRDCIDQTSDNIPNTATNQESTVENANSLRTLLESSAEFLDQTKSTAEKKERNTTSNRITQSTDYDFVSVNRNTEGSQEEFLNTSTTNNKQKASSANTLRTTQPKQYDKLKNIRVTLKERSDNINESKSNIPHFLSWSNKSSVAFGEIDFRTGISYDDLLLGFGVYGDDLVPFNDHAKLHTNARETKSSDQLQREMIRETKYADNFTGSNVNHKESDDHAGVSSTNNAQSTNHLYITMLRERQRTPAIITSKSTTYTVFDKFASDVSVNVNRFKTYAYMTRVLRLASYILDGFVYNDGVYDEIVYGFADEHKHLNMPMYTKTNEEEHTNRANLLRTHNRLRIEHAQPSRVLNKQLTNHTQDNITIPLPVEPLDTPYQHPDGVNIEYGNFATFVFLTKEYDVSTDEYTPTLGFHHRGYVEDLDRNFIKETGCSEFGSRTKWIAYVDTSYLEPWEQYYCTFTWDINGSKKIQRIKFRVVMDNDTMKHISEYKG